MRKHNANPSNLELEIKLRTLSDGLSWLTKKYGSISFVKGHIRELADGTAKEIPASCVVTVGNIAESCWLDIAAHDPTIAILCAIQRCYTEVRERNMPDKTPKTIKPPTTNKSIFIASDKNAGKTSPVRTPVTPRS